ncbi:MAG TPA: CBS domain-containing protein [Candidatus Dormibacteraeota bacterium]
MTSQVHVARPLTPFKVLVQLIEDNKISAVPIVDEQGIPVGIVSESDLLLKERREELQAEMNLLHPRLRREQRAKADGVVAAQIMTAPPITVGSNTTLAQAARKMQERNVRRLIVVDERGKIEGIVSRSDLLQVFLRTDEQLRDDVVSTIIPELFLPDSETINVRVHWNVVTLSGEVDRKSDVEILTRLTRQIDGVVDVVNQLTYRWDDTTAPPTAAWPVERSFRAF